jgi:hypothetical protein
VPSLTPLLGGVGRFITLRHDPLQVELQGQHQSGDVDQQCGRSHDVVELEKVGGTGTSARSREISKMGK